MMWILNDDAMEARWLAYLIYCNVENKCYLLRMEKMAILIVLRYAWSKARSVNVVYRVVEGP